MLQWNHRGNMTDMSVYLLPWIPDANPNRSAFLHQMKCP